MKEFALCIEYLLLDRNSVEVPGIGTFIALPIAARIDNQDGVILPPCRMVRLTRDMQQDEDTLVSDIARIYNISKEKANQRLTEWVVTFHQTLEDCGTLDFGSIGVFSIEEDGEIVFTSAESGVVTPEFYGLDACLVHAVDVENQDDTHAHNEHITIHLSRRLVRYATAACVAIIMFFAYSQPVTNMDVVTMESAAEVFMPIHLTPNANASTSLLVEKQVDGMHEQQQEIVTPVVVEEQSNTKQAIGDITSAKYCLVVASAVSEKNGKYYAEQLLRRGYDARVLETANMRRVVIGSYATEEEARAAQVELHQTNEFSSAWIMSM